MRKLPAFVLAAAAALTVFGAPMTSHAATIRVVGGGNGMNGYMTSCNTQNLGAILNQMGGNSRNCDSNTVYSMRRNTDGYRNSGFGQNSGLDQSCEAGFGCGLDQSCTDGFGCGAGQACADSQNCGFGQSCADSQNCGFRQDGMNGWCGGGNQGGVVSRMSVPFIR